MLNPCANSKLKRKRKGNEIHNANLTIDKQEEKDVNKEKISSNDGTLFTHLASSPKNVSSPTIFILDNASLQKGLVRKKWKILNSDEDAQFMLKQ
ncbi:hypothetical protein Fmac_004606 [Flemingia macrophylla]|uniref:Uncharacterized protein n=1 Tax=Flemingia macrophylla TaxID=520843 RepID=A0ABD1N624_9FABA